MMYRKRLLFAALLVLLAAAVWLRATSGGQSPPDLSRLSLPEVQERAAREPHNHWLQLEMGMRYVRLGRKSEAEGAFQRCLALAPRTMEAYAYLGTMHLQKGQNHEAAAMFERAVACDPRFASAYLELGNVYYGLNNFRSARRAVDRYVKLKPEDWQGYYLRGLVLFMEGEHERAEEDYARSVRLAPDRPTGYLAAGLACLFRSDSPKDLARAVQWFERGLKVDPRYPDLHYNLGLARFRQHQWGKSAAALQEAVRLNPKLTEAYYPLAQALLKLGRTAEARRYLAGYSRLRSAEKERSARQIERGVGRGL